jgi:hypothetical protein
MGFNLSIFYFGFLKSQFIQTVERETEAQNVEAQKIVAKSQPPTGIVSVHVIEARGLCILL